MPGRRTLVVLAAGAALVAACGGGGATTTTPRIVDTSSTTTTTVGPGRAEAIAEVESALAAWQAAGIDDYSYTIERRCFCPALLHARVVVEAGEVTSVELLAEGGDTEWAREELSETIDEVIVGLLEGLRSGDEEPGPIELSFDPDLGFPTEASVDPILDAVDDEFGFSITDFTALSAETAGTFDPAHQATTVTAQMLEIDVPDAFHDLVLGGVLQGTFDDGAAGAAPVVITTGGGLATAIRGRWCGTWWGPAPLSDGSDGVVVSTDQPSVVRCAPGEEIVAVAGGGGFPFDVGVVDGRVVVALLEWGSRQAVAVDLASGEIGAFFQSDGEVVSASYGGGRWLVATLEDDGTRLDLELYDESGTPIAAGMPPATPGWRPVTIDDSGTRIAWIEHGDEPIEPGGPPVQLVVWDTIAGAEIDRIEVVIADGLRANVGDIDFRGAHVILGVYGYEAERYPARALLVDVEDGSVARIDLGMADVGVVMAAFAADLEG